MPPPKVQVRVGARIAGKVPAVNNVGIKYPRWHSKHPANAIVVPASVAPTKAPGT